jgi:hypothetical protein
MISKESILVILGSPIAYYTAFAKAFGSVEAGIFTSQFFYWYGRGHNPEGWIYKTQEEIEQETGLTRRNQETARKRLRALGVLEETRMGAPSRLFYRLNLDRLFLLIDRWTTTGSLLEENMPEGHDGGFRHRTMAESAILSILQRIHQRLHQRLPSSSQTMPRHRLLLMMMIPLFYKLLLPHQ